MRALEHYELLGIDSPLPGDDTLDSNYPFPIRFRECGRVDRDRLAYRHRCRNTLRFTANAAQVHRESLDRGEDDKENAVGRVSNSYDFRSINNSFDGHAVPLQVV